MELHVYDLFMIVVILVATLFGAWKGMAWQIASITSLVASYWVAVRFSPSLAPHLGAEAPWNKFLAMLIIYLLTSASIWVLFNMISSMIERVKLQEFDQQVGALFGAFKGVVICVAITFFAVSLSQPARETILHTYSGKYTIQALHFADAAMPEEFNRLVRPYLDEIQSDQPTEIVGTPAPIAPTAQETLDEQTQQFRQNLEPSPVPRQANQLFDSLKEETTKRFR